MIDEQIIDNIKQGNDDWIEFIYKKNRNQLVGWLKKTLHIEHDAAVEIFHTSVIVFYENVKNGKIHSLTSSIQTYLFSVGKRKAYSHIREKTRFTLLEPEDIHENVSSNSLDFNFENEYKERTDWLEQELPKLGPPCLDLIRLFYFEEKPWSEISELLGYKSVESAKNVKYKCLERLRANAKKIK